MGLLDDAIKEHLDLKRRRGADPAEVKRAEQEALGPVRRSPAAQKVEVAGERHSDEGFPYEDADEDAWSDEAPEGVPSSAASPASGEPDLGSQLDEEDFVAPEPRQRSRPSRLARIFGRPESDSEDDPEYDDSSPARRPTGAPPAPTAPAPPESFPAPEPPESFLAPEPAPTPPPAPHPAPGVGGETMEYDVERALGTDEPEAEAGRDDEDVLEETPEFLHDTPDHDRLWFEQRPPRDFDFDG